MEENRIDEKGFDAIMGIIFDNPRSKIVIDNGASSFLPLAGYLITNQVLELLDEHGHAVVFHTIVTGGQDLLDTITGLGELMTQFPARADFIVWLNEYFVAIEGEGKTFREMRVYQEHAARIKKVITLPRQSELFAQDMKQMLEAHLTFDEAIRSEAFQFMSKHRLQTMRKALFE